VILMMQPDAGHQEPTRMPKSIPPESGSELLRRRRKGLMQSSSIATGRNDHERNADRGNGDEDSATPEILVPDPQVWREFNVSSMTLARWTADPTLGFPPPLKINGRNFRSRRLLEKFKEDLLHKAIADRAGRAA
jgi:hypothetical protein